MAKNEAGKSEFAKMAAKLVGGDAEIVEISRAKELVESEKGKESPIFDDYMSEKPLISIDGEKYPAFKSRNPGETVILLVECKVSYVSEFSHMKDGKAVKRSSTDLLIENMAEVN